MFVITLGGDLKSHVKQLSSALAAHKNHLGQILEMQMAGPHPRKKSLNVEPEIISSF